jgi:hypothetical protein
MWRNLPTCMELQLCTWVSKHGRYSYKYIPDLLSPSFPPPSSSLLSSFLLLLFPLTALKPYYFVPLFFIYFFPVSTVSLLLVCCYVIFICLPLYPFHLIFLSLRPSPHFLFPLLFHLFHSLSSPLSPCRK